ncbi:hypothetical protein X777_04293 [Ooceraea biroi]|uniref:Uncharacterized protein n=1 Tax=Ooceraea biroi TaxID=2015173 RepID=A0A026WJ33_OOCBI|nr:hypothetical protein X777_04293 [Ooceraea biroi]
MCSAIAGLPSAHRYQSLKMLLVEHYSLTRGQELRKLLSGLSVKDKKPSRLLAEMRSLAGPGRIDDKDYKTLFLEYLPSDVRMTLQVVPGDVNVLAAVADKIMEQQPPDDDCELVAIQQPEHDLANKIAELTKQLNELKVHHEPTSRSHSRPRSRSRTRTSTHSKQTRS